MAARVTPHAYSLRSWQGSRHGQPSVIADIEQENMRSHLLVISCFWICGPALSQPFAYDIKADMITQTDNGMKLDAFVRIAGEPHTKVRLFVSSNSTIDRIVNAKRATNDLEFSYFRIQTIEQIPEARPMRIPPRLDIVTKEVMSDLALNEKYTRGQDAESEWDGHLNPYPLRETAILSFTEITQNEFLGIKPKIVTPKTE